MDLKRDETFDAALWLDDEQQRVWRGVVELCVKLPAAVDGDLQRSSGLTLYEYEVLAILSQSAGRTLKLSELAAKTFSSLSRLSHVLSRLEKRGWVLRKVCPNDGRATLGVLTETGLAKVVSAAPGHVRTVRDLVVDVLTPTQLRQLGIAAAKIGEHIEEWGA